MNCNKCNNKADMTHFEGGKKYTAWCIPCLIKNNKEKGIICEIADCQNPQGFGKCFEDYGLCMKHIEENKYNINCLECHTVLTVDTISSFLCECGFYCLDCAKKMNLPEKEEYRQDAEIRFNSAMEHIKKEKELQEKKQKRHEEGLKEAWDMLHESLDKIVNYYKIDSEYIVKNIHSVILNNSVTREEIDIRLTGTWRKKQCKNI